MASEAPIWTRVWRNLKSDLAERRGLGPMVSDRDMTAAIGREGGPASWQPDVAGAPVALHQRDWADARWSSIFRRDTAYASSDPVDPSVVAEANLRGRRGDPPEVVQGPMMKAAVWTWEVPVYFWFGGMTAASTFIAFGCDLAGDWRAARIARGVAFAALMPCPPLLVMDLGRPERFHHMLRIFKVRSPMSMGSWCLSVYGGVAFAATVCDVFGRRRSARVVGALNVPFAMYLGSYTGVLLASTAVPLWSRSRRFLGPIFISTATLTGAATVKTVLSALGRDRTDPVRVALARTEDGAMAAELILSAINHHRLGALTSAMETGDGAVWFTRASWAGRAGMAARVASRRVGLLEHVASACFAGASLCYRMAWVSSGRTSAHDDAAVASNARQNAPVELTITQHQGQKPPPSAYGA